VNFLSSPLLTFSPRARCRWWLAIAACGLSLPSVAAVTCTVSATAVAFGVYNPLSATATVSTSTVTATCTLIGNNAERVDIVSSYSTGSSGTYSARTMQWGTNTLNYNLYFDSAYTRIRGDGTGGTQTGTASFILNNGQRTRSTSSTIYGRVPASQDVAAGTYSDTITVTITY
jgi:spore coat protein U-like protein